MTQSDMNPGEDDLLAKLEKLDAGTLYVSYRCRKCGFKFTTGDGDDETSPCPLCDGVADKVWGAR